MMASLFFCQIMDFTVASALHSLYLSHIFSLHSSIPYTFFQFHLVHFQYHFYNISSAPTKFLINTSVFFTYLTLSHLFHCLPLQKWFLNQVWQYTTLRILEKTYLLHFSQKKTLGGKALKTKLVKQKIIPSDYLQISKWQTNYFITF